MSETVLTTLMSTLGGLGVAYLGYLGIKSRIRRAKRKNSPDLDPDDELVVSYENDPAKFVKDVLHDREWMSSEIRKLREDYDSLREETTTLRAELETQRRDETRFRDALGRWLVDLFAAWGKTPAMPWPKAHDLEILKSVLPDRN